MSIISKLNRSFKVLGLAIRDLFHESVLTICMCLAIAAILSPLLVLAGVRNGSLLIMEKRLLQDPRTLEIRPMGAGQFTSEWLEKIRALPEVNFVIPATREISTSAFLINSLAASCEVDLIPSAKNDPLLTTFNTKTPENRGVILTHSASQELSATPGSNLELEVTRIENGEILPARIDVHVLDVLPPEADGQLRAYCVLPFLENIESYKDGIEVLEFGWEGQSSLLSPSYDTILVLADDIDILTPTLEAFCSTAGLNLNILSANDLVDYGANESLRAFSIIGNSQGILISHFEAIQQLLQPFNANLLRQIGPLEATIEIESQKHSASVRVGKEDLSEETIIVPLAMEGSDPILSYSSRLGDVKLQLKAVTINNSGSTDVFVHPLLAGRIRESVRGSLPFSVVENQLRSQKPFFASFRLYANNLDDVITVQQLLKNEGIHVSSQAHRAEELKTLEHNFNLLIGVVVVLGALGGTACLMASQFASVERKTRHLGHLLLLGLTPWELSLFPTFQAIIITSGGVLIALCMSLGISEVIQAIFHQHLSAGERLCWLSANQILTAAFVAVACSIAASVAALGKVTRIQLADVIRQE